MRPPRFGHPLGPVVLNPTIERTELVTPKRNGDATMKKRTAEMTAAIHLSLLVLAPPQFPFPVSPIDINSLASSKNTNACTVKPNRVGHPLGGAFSSTEVRFTPNVCPAVPDSR